MSSPEEKGARQSCHESVTVYSKRWSMRQIPSRAPCTTFRQESLQRRSRRKEWRSCPSAARFPFSDPVLLFGIQEWKWERDETAWNDWDVGSLGRGRRTSCWLETREEELVSLSPFDQVAETASPAKTMASCAPKRSSQKVLVINFFSETAEGGRAGANGQSVLLWS